MYYEYFLYSVLCFMHLVIVCYEANKNHYEDNEPAKEYQHFEKYRNVYVDMKVLMLMVDITEERLCTDPLL